MKSLFKKKKKAEIKLTAKPSVVESVCEFFSDVPFLKENRFNCTSREFSKGSPLLEGLFQFQEIYEIFVEEKRLVIKKKSPQPWTNFAPMVGKVIRDIYNNNDYFFHPDFDFEAPNKTRAEAIKIPEHLDQNDPIVKRLVTLFIEEINPSLAGHGGYLTFKDYKDFKVYVTLGGGCQGCGLANVTLKDGIEKLIKEQIPEIKEVVDVTEHDKGENPFYS